MTSQLSNQCLLHFKMSLDLQLLRHLNICDISLEGLTLQFVPSLAMKSVTNVNLLQRECLYFMCILIRIGLNRNRRKIILHF